MESEPTSNRPGPWSATAARANAGLRSLDRWREVRSLPGGGVSTVLPDGRPVVQFASNDYLGLSGHPAVRAAAARVNEELGTGSGASRLVVGSRPVHDRLEAALADWKHTESAVLFSSGYAANVGVLTSLARLGEVSGEPVTIVSDELNHASIIDGARLARVPVEVYPHADVAAAAEAVAAARAGGRRAVVVTDTVFSMDGDVAPLWELAEVTASSGALLVLDDAHAVFPGQGADALVHAPGERLVVGTLSKSLGGLGGFVATDDALAGWIRNTARSFIFSTATPPGVAAAALEALTILRSPDGEALTGALRSNVDRLAPGHPSAVVPVVLGDEARTLEVSAALADRGLLVPAIRPPTVAPGTSRLRVALSAGHSEADVDRLVAALDELGVWRGVSA